MSGKLAPMHRRIQLTEEDAKFTLGLYDQRERELTVLLDSGMRAVTTTRRIEVIAEIDRLLELKEKFWEFLRRYSEGPGIITPNRPRQ